MADMTVELLLRQLEASPSIRPEFASGLYETLAGQLGLRDTGPLAALRRRVRGSGIFDTLAGAGLRPAWAVALVGLLLIAMLALALSGGTLLRRSPAELVRLSQAAYDHPPAFSETFRDAIGDSHRLASDGSGTWRVDELNARAAPGTYWLYDGTREGNYDPSGNVWQVDTLATMGGSIPPFPFQGEFTWARTQGPPGSPSVIRTACSGATRMDDAVVAGRPADHLRCGDSNMQYWLDRTTHLILRVEAGAGTPNWDAGASMEATAFEVLDVVDPAAFSWDGPPTSTGLADEPASHLLKVGDQLPNVAGTTLDGTRFETDSLRGRPSAILVWGRGYAGPELRLFAAATRSRVDRLASVVLWTAFTYPGPGYARVAAADVGFSGTTLLPDVGPVSNSADSVLGLSYWPALILVYADGRIASLGHQVAVAADLEAMLDATIAGAPVPVPTWVPGPGEPANGVSHTLAIGQLPPDWTLPNPTGGTLSPRDLIGAPAIFYYGQLIGGDDFDAPRTRMLEALAGISGTGPGAVRVVVIDSEPFMAAADVAALSSRLRLPVVPDRDAIVSRAWGFALYDDLLFLDASGRVVAFVGGACLDTQALLAQFAAAQPMPSPTRVSVAPGCP